MPKGVYPRKGVKHIPWTAGELEPRITVIKETMARIEALPPALGSNWREGMLRYYKRILTEMEGYRDAGVQAQSRSK